MYPPRIKALHGIILVGGPYVRPDRFPGAPLPLMPPFSAFVILAKPSRGAPLAQWMSGANPLPIFWPKGSFADKRVRQERRPEPGPGAALVASVTEHGLVIRFRIFARPSGRVSWPFTLPSGAEHVVPHARHAPGGAPVVPGAAEQARRLVLRASGLGVPVGPVRRVIVDKT